MCKPWPPCDGKYISPTPPPHVKEFWIPFHGFRIPCTGFRIACQWNLDAGLQLLVGFLIPLALLRVPKSRIIDFLDSGTRIPLPDGGRYILKNQQQAHRPTLLRAS